MKKLTLFILLACATLSLFSQTKESSHSLTAFPSSLVKSYELVSKDSTNKLLVTFENGYSLTLPCIKNIGNSKFKKPRKPHVRPKEH